MKTLYFLPLFFPFIVFANTVPLKIQEANTDQKRCFGLMQKTSLPENEGMLFIYRKPACISVWMFNCLIDLSIAFIDKNGIIVEIHELKAYPEMMDPERVVSTINDLHLYPPNDPIYQFFQRKRTVSKAKAQYALEMNSQWFSKNGIHPGDKLVWEPGKSNATILLQNRRKIRYGFK